ncbi:calponin homology domain-containing protein DDB_G0272472-like [Hydractinia symbiolongicarpus]|uniref:calponin homology domain-containing protein DDB_G0272472-like n=1 Tax=Hydractinia symbiolongicarpus TaxID=13093 RepID=UPI00254F2D66|nr:calponin homology domain-containing protein DDB_G0272472-like [Hydractinia symbiolongicarpus]
MTHKPVTKTLSVAAEEFVPSYKIPLSSTLSADVPEFVPLWKSSAELKNRGRFAQNKKKKNISAQPSGESDGIVKPSPINTTLSHPVKSSGVDSQKVKKQLIHSFSKESDQAWTKKAFNTSSNNQSIRNQTHKKKSETVKDSNVDSKKPTLSWSAIVQQPVIGSNKTQNVRGVNRNQCMEEAKTKINQVKAKSTHDLDEKQSIEKGKKQPKVDWFSVSEKKQSEIKQIPLSFKKGISMGNKEISGKSQKEDSVLLKSLSTENSSVAAVRNNHRVKTKESAKDGENKKELESNIEKKYEKKKLTRTFKSFSTSSIETENEKKSTKDLFYLNRFKNTQGDFLTKEFLNSYKQAIQQDKEPYKIIKIKNRVQKHDDADNVDNDVFESPPKQDIDDSAFPTLIGGRVSTPMSKMSYSNALKKAATQSNSQKFNSKQLSEEEIRAIRKKRKTEKRKEKVKLKKEQKRKEREELKLTSPSQGSSEKKSEQEIKLDISDMFDQLLLSPNKSKKAKNQKQKRTIISTGVISVVSGLAKKNTPDGRRKKTASVPTILDGSTLIRKRGKERETPKRKKPTLLKKIIKAERERKKRLNEKNNVTNEEKHSDEKVATDAVPFEEQPTVDDKTENQKCNDSHEEKRIPTLNNLPEHISKKLHSRKFREYCNHVLSKEINRITGNLLMTLQKFQDRVYHETPHKFKQKRRFVLGLREVLKHLKLKRLKAIVIAPNLERIASEGGLDDYLTSILSLCNVHGIPQIFAMNRHTLGRTVKKKAPVSVIGIFNYDGAQDIFKELMEHVHTAQETYNKKVNELMESEFGQIPNISLTTENDLEVEDIENTQPRIETETERIKNQILRNFSADEFRIVTNQHWANSPEGYQR